MLRLLRHGVDHLVLRVGIGILYLVLLQMPSKHHTGYSPSCCSVRFRHGYYSIPSLESEVFQNLFLKLLFSSNVDFRLEIGFSHIAIVAIQGWFRNKNSESLEILKIASFNRAHDISACPSTPLVLLLVRVLCQRVLPHIESYLIYHTPTCSFLSPQGFLVWVIAICSP